MGPILANEIPPTDSKFTDYILPLPHVFSLTKTSNDILLKLIQSLPLNKASGLDGISAKLLKEAGPIVSASLTYIINRSLTTGIFPNDWKVARVTPIYKDDIKTNRNNYRPISVLPIVSKLIERIVSVICFLNEARFTCRCSVGFLTLSFHFDCPSRYNQ